ETAKIEQKYRSELIINGENSLYINYIKAIKKGTTYIDNENKLNGEKYEIEEHFYKKGDVLYYPSPISYNQKSIIWQDDKLVWEINENITKNILGYRCFQAKTKYRGRNYMVYFTKELPYIVGPRMFYGLQGAVLEVEEEQGLLKIIVTKIEEKHKKIQPNYDYKTAISWEKALNIAKENYKKKQDEIYEKYGTTPYTDFSNTLEKYDLND
ncbi:MAG: GLPGLI family protein, partial [Bergeyella zoohelcum]|nr:GLPGLI family protein [Bergeyella zoohelcum]